MTGYTVHTGSNDKFAAGWDQVFSDTGPAKKKAKQADSEATASGKSAKKKSGKSGSKKGKRGK
jgi:hypothetical protein